MRDALPDAHLVALVRDPVARFRSELAMEACKRSADVRDPRFFDRLGFHRPGGMRRFLERAELRGLNESAEPGASARERETPEKLALFRGLYSAHLRRFLAVRNPPAPARACAPQRVRIGAALIIRNALTASAARTVPPAVTGVPARAAARAARGTAIRGSTQGDRRPTARDGRADIRASQYGKQRGLPPAVDVQREPAAQRGGRTTAPKLLRIAELDAGDVLPIARVKMTPISKRGT